VRGEKGEVACDRPLKREKEHKEEDIRVIAMKSLTSIPGRRRTPPIAKKKGITVEKEQSYP